MAQFGPGGPLNAIRERGYNDGFADRPAPSLTALTAAQRAAYLRGRRIGREDRERHAQEVEASRA